MEVTLHPPSPERSWAPPGLDKYEEQLTNKDLYAKQDAMSLKIDPEKVYDLPELIDIAERSNPYTRIAWEQARQAAKAQLASARAPIIPILRLRQRQVTNAN